METQTIGFYGNMISYFFHGLFKQAMAVVTLKGNDQEVGQIVVFAKRKFPTELNNEPNTSWTVPVSLT